MNKTIIYLRKSHKEPPEGTDFNEIIDDYEFPEEYIKRIKRKEFNQLTKQDIIFHLYQLMEICIDCRLTYEWLCSELFADKVFFFAQFDSYQKLFNLLNYRTYHFTNSEMKQFSEELKNSLRNDYEERLKVLFSDITKYNKYFHKHFYKILIKPFKLFMYKKWAFINDGFINGLIEQGIWLHLGLLSKTVHTIPHIIIKGKKEKLFNYTTGKIAQFDKKTNVAIVQYDLKTLYMNTANAALDYYILVWQLLERKDKCKNKTKIYESMNKKELIEIFFEKYEVQKNFLRLLQTKAYKEKITLDSEYKLIENNYLVISYLYDQANNGSDYKLLEKLFSKPNLPQYCKEYKNNALNDFISFLNDNKSI